MNTSVHFVSEMTEHHVYTVSELNRSVRFLLEEDFGGVWVKGEVSELKKAPSGHLYFTLKDETSELSAVRFRSRTSVLPTADFESGMVILAFGRLTVYEPRGRYQFVATLIQPVGAGALQIAFDRLKTKLQQEGLFAPEHKKPLPEFPYKIGVITSPSGAAIRDIVSVIARRWPLATIYLFPSAVQGDLALHQLPEAVDRAVRFAQTVTPLDLLIVGRGGGSAEDLAAFNSETLARALFASPIPIVSAVGHEIDFSIADFVADRRAATPTAAAELAVPDRGEIGSAISLKVSRLTQGVLTAHAEKSERLQIRLKDLLVRVPTRTLETLDQRLDQRLGLLTRAIADAFRARRTAVSHLEDILRLSDPRLPLKRGYSITCLEGSSRPIFDASSVALDQRVDTHLATGRLVSRVEEVMPE